jgi:predicted O-linked N-acetylglucosamine transferase (SPINDLY family)
LLEIPAEVPYTCYARPRIGDRKSRSDFGLPPDRTLYLCPHSLFKLHPDFYPALGRILEEDTNGVVVFVGANPSWTGFVRAMLEPFANTGRIIFIGKVRSSDFLAVLNIGDVLLDTFHFGGGNTSAEAIAAGIPIVTLPSEFMRGRFTLAWLRRLGVDDGIACSSEDYVARAVRMGRDREFRLDLRNRIGSRCSQIFDNVASVRATERLLLNELGI